MALLDRCIFNATSTGTVDFVVASAVTGYLTPSQANALDSIVYSYAAETRDTNGNITAWEVGQGAYTASSATLARTTIIFSSNSNAKVNFASAPKVMLSALTESFREKLTGNRTYYIRTDGSDSNNGLSNTAAGAWLTRQHASDVIQNTLDLAGYNVTVQVGPGTYTDNFAIDGVYVGDRAGVLFTGDTTTPSNVVINSDFPFFADSGSYFQVQGFKLMGCAVGGIVATGFSTVVISGKMDFGAAPVVGMHLVATADGEIIINTDYTISGNVNLHIYAASVGHIQQFDRTVTLTGTPAWGTAFIRIEGMGDADIERITYSGAATGKRFEVKNNGLLYTQTANWNYFPGDTDGTLDQSGCWNSVHGNMPMACSSSDLVGADDGLAHPWFGAAFDTLNIAANTLYEMEALVVLNKSAGTNSHTVSLLFALSGTSFTSGFLTIESTGLTAPLATWDSSAFASGFAVSGSITSASVSIIVTLRGYFRTNTGGTLIPQYQCSTAPGGAYTVAKNSFFRIASMGPTSTNTVNNDFDLYWN